MTEASASDLVSPTDDIQSVLDSVIGAGKSAVHRIGADEVRRLAEHQVDVRGEVRITVTGDGGEVGASNGIVVFDAEWDSADGPVSRELVLRHAPGSDRRLFFEYDLARQFTVQQALFGTGIPVPQPLWLDTDGRWLGVPGYVMSRTEGIAPSPAAFVRGPLADASEADREEMIGQIMRTLVRIHRTDVAASGLSDFVMNAPGSTPLERCINWYWRTWDWIALPHRERLVSVREALLKHAPSGEPELLHGDTTLQNYLFNGTQLVAVLDWEMSTLGRAEADLALQCLSNELFAPPVGSPFAQPPSEAEWLDRYRDAGGRSLRDFGYYKKLAAYMVIVAVSALQRNMSEEERSAHEPLLRPCWKLVAE
ncbi:aminoglycoside phosphotransferase (APT) family kinase protein [Mycolicibacterium sp. BK556]|uniref:phosphotransferase family protein n=1 Tax=Mycobacteriaceae TaxID=1762 RepID=UPI00106183C0|nr:MULTISPECIES: phosphotransferase family protein [Mycobacteriaceae]MBB3600592.1 aminoglycoside phosphotransferase (APT) family kinase protein [Mycolicibacterium sp. BK556]MBB3630345.1 aminoglycoside phosphotransferase (APT) family kinase protein [Mycolicibacterium sp. BK607]MBB3748344.1 aminoglycoside phosphotransferase (APT) family kinase protein [Mycolicibacterium sp. BK634]TDO10134.1 aminoglycoside phosphotransferase (APT) family kinase protein [Mycobacterium sp. BK086]